MTITAGGLDRVTLFSGLDKRSQASVEERCSWRRVAAGEVVFDKDSDTLEVFFIVEGAVRILTPGNDDQEVALADVVAGSYFGELAAIDGMKRSARVVATQDSLLASLEGAAFLGVMRDFPDIALRVLERLTRIVRNLDSRVTELSTRTEEQRVCGELLRLAQEDPGAPGAWRIPDLPSHKEIACWAGVTREQVAQVIGELARDGVVRRRGMALAIGNLARLKVMARIESAA